MLNDAGRRNLMPGDVMVLIKESPKPSFRCLGVLLMATTAGLASIAVLIGVLA